MSNTEGIEDSEEELSNHGNSHGYIPCDNVQRIDCPGQADRRYETIVGKRTEWGTDIDYYILRDTQTGDHIIASIGPGSRNYHVKTVFNPCTVDTTTDWDGGPIPDDPADVSGDPRYNARLHELLHDATEIEAINHSSLTCYDGWVSDRYTVHIHTED